MGEREITRTWDSPGIEPRRLETRLRIVALDVARKGRDGIPAAEYRFHMPADRELLGLAIVIYGTILGLFAWILHMIRSAPHPHLHAPTHARKNVVKR